MSRHVHRFERDYRSSWERRERPPLHLHNGTCSPAAGAGAPPPVANGNNRPGLLPLPVIPSLLPTPVTIAVTTASAAAAADLAGKRAMPPVSTAPQAVKVSPPSVCVCVCVC